MLAIKTFEQTGVFDPTNPQQRIREVYTGLPGGYGSFYWNRVPNTATLGRLGGSGWAGLPAWAQATIVAVGAGVIGYFGWGKFGGRIKGLVKR